MLGTRCVAIVASCVGVVVPASAVTIDWTFVGDPGNACDTQPQGCFGSVGYAYEIGTYEVTNAQYAEFLNAKASVSDPLQLYSEAMVGYDPYTGSHGQSTYGGIERSGTAGNYTYTPIAGRANMPVNLVSFYDALRFANWLNNGQGNADTESGAYTLLGGTPTPSNGLTVTRNENAQIFVPSEDEWYKAAYYDSSSASYFDYPANSNLPTACARPNVLPNRANCNNAVRDFTEVGSYPGSRSPYGTFDQGGNIWEWNEAMVRDGDRGVRGGGFDGAAGLAASDWGGFQPGGCYCIGFRVEAIPEPGTGALLVAGLLGLALPRKRH
jgi:formylglycine-generating enzyme required for sulfatase activity